MPARVAGGICFPEGTGTIQSRQIMTTPRIIATFKALGKQKINAWRAETRVVLERLHIFKCIALDYTF
jgi:hypothetical protein